MTDEQRVKVKLFMNAKQAELEAKDLAESLKAEVTQIVFNDCGGRKAKIESDDGALTVRVVKNWSYPQDIVDAEAKLKEDKKLAQQTGTAAMDEVPGLLYKRLKDAADID